MTGMLKVLTKEKGLDAQDYKCAQCKKPIGMSELGGGSVSELGGGSVSVCVLWKLLNCATASH